MKKKISLILAVVMAASMLAGCKKTDEDSAGLPDVGGETTTSMSELTQMTTETTTETTTEETTTTTEETTTETTTETSETTTAPSETTTAASATAATAAEKQWSETEISETLYIKTACYSREKAIVGSEAVKKYDVGQKINIVAATDTGYYKLADGTYIHSDYVTDQKPASVTTDATITAPKQDKEPEQTTTKKPTGGSSGTVNPSYTKSYEDRYPYQQLGSAEKELYANIVEAAENFEFEVSLPKGLDSEDIFKVYCLVFNQEPQLFWLSNSVPRAIGNTIYLDLALTEDEAVQAQKRIDKGAKEVLSKVNGYTSTVSKLKVIHDWVATHNIFSLQGNYTTCGIYNGLTGDGALQCQGYAKTVLYLCDLAGIECMVVTGNNTEGSTHAWNVVYCDNGYYILDVTWDDPKNIDYAKSDYVRYLFFLANDSMIKNTHLNISTMAMNDGTRVKLYDPPACTKTACYYFKAYNKEYSDIKSAKQAMFDEIDAAIDAGKNVVHIRVTDRDLWEEMRSKDNWKEFQNYAKSKDDDVEKVLQLTSLTEDVLVVQYDIVYKN